MQVSLGEAREVKVNDDVDRQDVDTTSKNVSAHETSGLTSLEVVINSLTIVVRHLGMNVEARVTHLRNLLCEQFDTLS